LSEKLEGLFGTGDTAVAEFEDLHGIVAESQERGFLPADALAAALEDSPSRGWAGAPARPTWTQARAPA
jgi:hypothetical protein